MKKFFPEEMFMDMVLLNGKVVTVDPKDTIAEAVAIKGNRIVKVATSEEIEAMAGKKTQVINLKGKTVLPGIINAHVHPDSKGAPEVEPWAGTNARQLALKSIPEILKHLKNIAKITPKGQLITLAVLAERPYISEKRYPTRQELDETASEHPVILRGGWANNRFDFLCNSSVLKAANITKDTPSPPRGNLEKDPKTGEPTGLLQFWAIELLPDWCKFTPEYKQQYTKEKAIQYIKKALEMELPYGVTSIGEARGTDKTMWAYQELLARGELPVRVSQYLTVFGYQFHVAKLPELLPALKQLNIRSGFGSDMIKIAGVKIMIGEYEATSFWYEPYADPDYPEYGTYRHLARLPAPDWRELFRIVAEAHEAGLQTQAHIKSDRSMDMYLDAVEWAQIKYPRKDLRHIITHPDYTPPETIKRIKKLGMACMFLGSTIAYKGMRIIRNLGPERAKWFAPIKSLIDAGIVCCAGTDLPTNVWHQAYHLITRVSETGEVVNPEQRISVMDAIRMYTTNAAYALCEEENRGSIEPGKLADLAVLSGDPLTMPVKRIKNIKAEMTVLGGKIIYQKA